MTALPPQHGEQNTTQKTHDTCTTTETALRLRSSSVLPPRPVTEADLPSFRRLIQDNECLCTLGTKYGNEEWVQMGTAYVESVLDGELGSWEACQRHYEEQGSQLWMLELEEEEEEGSSAGRENLPRLVGSIGVVMHTVREGKGGACRKTRKRWSLCVCMWTACTSIGGMVGCSYPISSSMPVDSASPRYGSPHRLPTCRV